MASQSDVEPTHTNVRWEVDPVLTMINAVEILNVVPTIVNLFILQMMMCHQKMIAVIVMALH